MEGKIVCWIQNRGFGFIQAENEEYFFHVSNCLDKIALGADVEFQSAPPIRLGKGPQAINIKVIQVAATKAAQ